MKHFLLIFFLVLARVSFAGITTAGGVIISTPLNNLDGSGITNVTAVGGSNGVYGGVGHTNGVVSATSIVTSNLTANGLAQFSGYTASTATFGSRNASATFSNPIVVVPNNLSGAAYISSAPSAGQVYNEFDTPANGTQTKWLFGSQQGIDGYPTNNFIITSQWNGNPIPWADYTPGFTATANGNINIIGSLISYRTNALILAELAKTSAFGLWNSNGILFYSIRTGSTVASAQLNGLDGGVQNGSGLTNVMAVGGSNGVYGGVGHTNGVVYGNGASITNITLNNITNVGTAAYSNSIAFYLNSNPSNYISQTQGAGISNSLVNQITSNGIFGGVGLTNGGIYGNGIRLTNLNPTNLVFNSTTQTTAILNFNLAEIAITNNITFTSATGVASNGFAKYIGATVWGTGVTVAWPQIWSPNNTNLVVLTNGLVAFKCFGTNVFAAPYQP